MRGPDCRFTKLFLDIPAGIRQQIASHMFTRRLLTEGTKVAVREGRRLVRRLHAVAASGKEVDAQALFFQFTMAR